MEPKAILSNRIYMSTTPELTKMLDEELTYSIPSYSDRNAPTIMKTMKRINPHLISIPIGREDLIPEGYEIKDKRIITPAKFPELRGSIILRENQQIIHDKVDSNVIINAKPSWGKTFTGIAIAHKLGMKTLVVTHTIAIRSQWVKEYKAFFGKTPSIVGSGKLELDGPLVVANIQSLYKHMAQLSQMFGLLLVDEVHRVPSRTFSKIVDSNYAKIKIGLSGTLERKDGKHVVLRDYFGPVVLKPPRENQMTPNVHLIKSRIRFMDGSSTPWALRENDLANNEEYRHLVSMLSAAYAAKGHNVLTVANRVYFLKRCAELAGDTAISITGEDDYTERDKLESRLEKGEINQIFGTGKIFSEGISIPPLSCLILAGPINNMPLLEQLIGRIQREMEGKQTPIVVDINLKGNTASRQATARLGFYMQQGFRYKTFEA